MISQIFSPCERLLDSLRHDHYSRRVKSHYFAYKTDYDFSRLFEISKDSRTLGAVSVFNASMIVACAENETFDSDTLSELAGFILMISPSVIEIPVEFAPALEKLLAEDYSIDHRTQFEFVSRNELPALDVNELPRLDDVFRVLSSSFPSLAQSYELWITDTSHRVRRGLSQSFLLGDYSTATIQYIVDKVALIGHVATVPERRGEFHARRLLYWIGERLTRDGFTVRLFARPHRVSYYEEIGFKAIAHDIVFERIDVNDD